MRRKATEITSPVVRAACLAVLVLSILTWIPVAVRAEWRIWPDFVAESTLHLDQSQTEGAAKALVLDNRRKGVGQTFRPSATQIHRIDVQIRNRADERPARFRLWRWRGSQERTEQESPLFDDAISTAGLRHDWHTRSVFPDVAVTPGVLYYFRLDAEGRTPLELRSRRGGDDSYLRGELVAWHLRDLSGTDDLWFQTWARGKALSGADTDISPPPSPEAAEAIRWSPPPAPADVTVSTDDYRGRVERYVEWLRSTYDSSCGANDGRAAQLEAFLYRLSCEEGGCRESLARNGMERLLHFARWQECDFRGGRERKCRARCERSQAGHFDSLDSAIDAIAWLRTSPSWDPRAEPEIADVIRRRAREYWPRRQMGSGSRAFMGASVLLRLANLFPDDPDAGAWRGYAEEVWSDFRRHSEFQGGSAFYNSRITWPSVLQLAEEIDDADAMWLDPRFRVLVERYAAQMAPIGVLPGYGDATGWATDSPGLVWLFEEAARRTGEGRYRWLAHQVFLFNRDRSRDDPPARDSWARKMPHLARAYLSARHWQGRPEPPAEASMVPVASLVASKVVWRKIGASRKIGQTFAHEGGEGGSLLRIGLRIRGKNASDVRLRIWRWRDGLTATRRSVPFHSSRPTRREGDGDLFSSSVVFPMDESGTYYLELDAPLGADALVAVAAEDLYADGRAYGVRDSRSDLAFALHAFRGTSSVVTWRLASEQQSVSDFRKSGRFHRFAEGVVPDKLVLRSGVDPGDLYALVDLLTGYRHGQRGLGAFSAIIDRGSVLLAETSFPYWHYARRSEERNIAMVRRYRGGSPQEPGSRVELTRFVDTPNLTVAWLRFLDPEGWGIAQERRIYFVKNRFIWIRDRFDLPAGMLATVGSIWHPDVVLAPGTPGAGHRIAYPLPLDNVWPQHNPPRFARLWMPAHPGTVETHEQMTDHVASPECRDRAARKGPINPRCRISPSYAVHRSWTGATEEGVRVWIDSVLVPEAPEDFTQLETLIPIGSTAALSIEMQGESWILVDNPRGQPIRLQEQELESDALYIIARRERQEDLPYIHVSDATRFKGLGQIFESETPSSSEIGSFPP